LLKSRHFSRRNKQSESAARKLALGKHPNCADTSNFNFALQAERHLNSIKAYLENLSFNWEINIYLEWNNGASLEAILVRTGGVRGHFGANRVFCTLKIRMQAPTTYNSAKHAIKIEKIREKTSFSWEECTFYTLSN
jgi:hypothetical protein